MKEVDGRRDRVDSGNKKSTFEVTVRFHQNATWQCQILWIEKNNKQNFRSALEMLKLMDEAITETAENAQKTGWEKNS